MLNPHAHGVSCVQCTWRELCAVAWVACAHGVSCVQWHGLLAKHPHPNADGVSCLHSIETRMQVVWISWTACVIVASATCFVNHRQILPFLRGVSYGDQVGMAAAPPLLGMWRELLAFAMVPAVDLGRWRELLANLAWFPLMMMPLQGNLGLSPCLMSRLILGI